MGHPGWLTFNSKIERLKKGKTKAEASSASKQLFEDHACKVPHTHYAEREGKILDCYTANVGVMFSECFPGPGPHRLQPASYDSNLLPHCMKGALL